MHNERVIKDTVVEPVAKWPYFGQNIPPFIGVQVGVEGFPVKRLTVGITHNLFMLTVYGDGATTARAGYSLFYKKHFDANYPWSVEGEIGIWGIMAMGVNVNYNRIPEGSITGIKPFVGLSFFHLDFMYGYNFFNRKKDINDLLKHHVFTMRLNIPLIKLTKRKTVTHYIYEDDSE